MGPPHRLPLGVFGVKVRQIPPVAGPLGLPVGLQPALDDVFELCAGNDGISLFPFSDGQSLRRTCPHCLLNPGSVLVGTFGVVDFDLAAPVDQRVVVCI